MEKYLFNSWESVLGSLVTTLLAYLAIVFFLRITGKRTLSKMNAFDLIVTVALGSALATVSLSKSVPLADGAAVFFLLILLQMIFTWLSVRFRPLKKIITSEPTLLLYKGEVFEEVLKRQRITLEELFVAARSNGFATLKDIDAIILETTGDITVIHQLPQTKAQTLRDVEHYNEQKLD